MTTFNKILCATFLATLFLQTGCSYIYRTGFINVPKQLISESVIIGPDWSEIVPPFPLKPYGTSQIILLNVVGYKEVDHFHGGIDHIVELLDGRQATVEAYLFDEEGKSYELELYQSDTGPALTKKGDIKWSGRPNFSGPDRSELYFPSDRLYTRLRIRSDIPIKCTKIIWTGSNPR